MVLRALLLDVVIPKSQKFKKTIEKSPYYKYISGAEDSLKGSYSPALANASKNEKMRAHKIAWNWYKESPLGFGGVPLVIFKALPFVPLEGIQNIWNPKVNSAGVAAELGVWPAIKPNKNAIFMDESTVDDEAILPFGVVIPRPDSNKIARYTSRKDNFDFIKELGGNLDLGMGKIQLDGVFFSCAACHTGRVIVGEGDQKKVLLMYGAPSTEIDQQLYGGVLRQSARYLFEILNVEAIRKKEDPWNLDIKESLKLLATGDPLHAIAEAKNEKILASKAYNILRAARILRSTLGLTIRKLTDDRENFGVFIVKDNGKKQIKIVLDPAEWQSMKADFAFLYSQKLFNIAYFTNDISKYEVERKISKASFFYGNKFGSSESTYAGNTNTSNYEERKLEELLSPVGGKIATNMSNIANSLKQYGDNLSRLMPKDNYLEHLSSYITGMKLKRSNGKDATIGGIPLALLALKKIVEPGLKTEYVYIKSVSEHGDYHSPEKIAKANKDEDEYHIKNILVNQKEAKKLGTFGNRIGQMDAFGMSSGLAALHLRRPEFYETLKQNDQRISSTEKDFPNIDAINNGVFDAIQTNNQIDPDTGHKVSPLVGSRLNKKDTEGKNVIVDKRDLRNPNVWKSSWLPPGAAIVDIKSMYYSSNKKYANWDGNQDREARVLASGVSSVGDPAMVNYEVIQPMNNFIDYLPPAPYPFEIDLSKVEAGKNIYRDPRFKYKGIDVSCQSCHGNKLSEELSGEIYSDKMSKVNTRGLFSTEEIGTDPGRAVVNSEPARRILADLILEACGLWQSEFRQKTGLEDIFKPSKTWCLPHDKDIGNTINDKR
ncbi:MAG: hypothetical protein R3B45_08675 [Bdellovibrionota bacterium]